MAQVVRRSSWGMSPREIQDSGRAFASGMKRNCKPRVSCITLGFDARTFLSSRQTCVILITQLGTMGMITFCEFMYLADDNSLRCCYDCMCRMRRSEDCEFARNSGKN